MNFEYFEAAMVPLLDNTLKYILHDSTLHIYFKNSEEGFIINFDMISMAITKEEEEDIMKYGFSGINAKKNQKNGKGIGMTTIKDSLKVNNAKIKFENNVNGRREKRYKNTTYERNIFKIIFLDQ